MLYRYCKKFLEYCRLADFSSRSIQARDKRLGERRSLARTLLSLAALTAEFNNPSGHVRKSKVWTLRQFCHFLSLHGYSKNIAKTLP